MLRKAVLLLIRVIYFASFRVEIFDVFSRIFKSSSFFGQKFGSPKSHDELLIFGHKYSFRSPYRMDASYNSLTLNSSCIDDGDGCWRPNVLVTSLRCWWPIQYIVKVTNIMILPPTSQISHRHKITNITISPTSLSPNPELIPQSISFFKAWQ